MLRRHRFEIFLVAAIVLVTAGFVRWQYIPTFADRHVEVAEQKYGFDVGEPGKWFSAWSLGDGQAYAMIAVDPSGELLATHVSEAGYRFARAGYGWAAWVASLGEERYVPYGLAVVGAISLLGVLILAVYMRPRLGPRSWLIVFNPALFVGFAGDTSEPLGILVLGAAFAWGLWSFAALVGVIRPTYLVSMFRERRLVISGLLAAAGLGLYSLLRFGADALIPAGGRLSLPGLAYVDQVSVWGLLLAVVAIGTLVIGIRRRDWAWVLAGAFVLCFGSDVLRDPVNAWRAAGFLPMMWAFGPGFDPGRFRGSATGLRHVEHTA